jgi:hypothetical protein
VEVSRREQGELRQVATRRAEFSCPVDRLFD